MLKAKPLNELLSQSISPNVSSALLFTPSSSLLATGTSPVAPDAKKFRTYAALAANIWSIYERVATSGAIEDSFAPPLPPAPPDLGTGSQVPYAGAYRVQPTCAGADPNALAKPAKEDDRILAALYYNARRANGPLGI